MLIVLVIGNIVCVSAVCRVRVATWLAGVVCCVLGGVVGWAGSTWWAWCGGGGWGSGGLSAAATAICAVGIGGAVTSLLLAVILTSVAAIGTLGRVFFEALVLLFYVAKEIFAELAGVLHFFGIRAAVKG